MFLETGSDAGLPNSDPGQIKRTFAEERNKNKQKRLIPISTDSIVFLSFLQLLMVEILLLLDFIFRDKISQLMNTYP